MEKDKKSTSSDWRKQMQRFPTRPPSPQRIVTVFWFSVIEKGGKIKRKERERERGERIAKDSESWTTSGMELTVDAALEEPRLHSANFPLSLSLQLPLATVSSAAREKWEERRVAPRRPAPCTQTRTCTAFFFVRKSQHSARLIFRYC